METINFDTWFERYKPQLNHFNSSLDNDNYTFETFGEELEYVKKQNNKQIWTSIECENEEVWIIPGYHLINRMNYYITNILWESEDIQVNDNEMCTIEEAIDYCMSFAEEHLNLNLSRYNISSYFLSTLDSIFDKEMSIGRAKYTAISYYEDVLNMESDDFDNEIHNYYSQLK